jgi:dTDP-4-amino-4,6-dideoxygalactose transaminase
MDWRIPLFKIYWDKDDINAVACTIKRGMRWAEGPEITEFEQALAAYINVKYCLTMNSGTSALHALLLAYGIGPGDEVIVPSFTFISTANSVLFVGARPVFADIEEKTYGLDPADIERKITDKTKAIIPVHVAGSPCLIKEIADIARRHNLLLIEDNAEALGARAGETKTGSIGDAAILSFCQNKPITTGEGGAVVTNSEEVYEKLKLIRSHGREDKKDVNYFTTTDFMDYITLGYNFRMSSILAALGLAQLKKIDKIIDMRRICAHRYDDLLSRIENVTIHQPPPDYYHVYQMYNIMVPSPLRDGLREHLSQNGILTKVNFYCIHKTQFYRDVLKYNISLPVTEKISSQSITLPLHPEISRKDIGDVVGCIADYMANEKSPAHRLSVSPAPGRQPPFARHRKISPGIRLAAGYPFRPPR